MKGFIIQVIIMSAAVTLVENCVSSAHTWIICIAIMLAYVAGEFLGAFEARKKAIKAIDEVFKERSARV